MTNYRQFIKKDGDKHVIKCKHVHSGLYLSRTVKVGEVHIKDNVWKVVLEHVDGSKLATVESDGGEALLTLGDEDSDKY